MSKNDPIKSPQRWRRLHRWGALVVAWILIPLFILGVLEFGLRLAGYGGSVAPFRVVDTDRGRIHICNFEYLYAMFSTEPGVGLNYVEFVIPEEKEANTYRIFVFGSSAAFGWTHNSSFAQLLQLMLMQRYPGVRFEVYNLANGGLNSSIMRPLAAACANMQPDAYVIYMGNNEVHGPYGLVTEFQMRSGRVPSPLEIRLHQALRRLRLGQLLDHLSRGRSGSDGPRENSETLRPDDPRLPQVWRNYEYNLRDMFASAASASAPVFVSTLGANLRHWPPQANLVWDKMSGEEQAEFDAWLHSGHAHEDAGAWQEALEAYARAEQINNTSPYLFFRQANCYWGLGEFDQARVLYEKALEQDSFVWVRAKRAFNDTIRRAVDLHPGNGVFLVEGRAALEAAAPHATPGNESFADGCHFRPEGMYVVARAFYEQMIPNMPEWVREHEDIEAVVPDLSELFEVLGFDENLREDILQQLIVKSREHGMDSAITLQEELDRIRAHPKIIDYARQIDHLRRIVAAGTEDLQLALKFMESLGRVPGSVDTTVLELVRGLSDRYAFDRAFQKEYAQTLMFQGREEEREQIYRRILSVYPWDDTAYMNLSLLLMDLEAVDEARQLLRQASRNRVDEGVYHYLRGNLLTSQGAPEAIEAYMKAVEADSDAYQYAVDGLLKSLSRFPDEAMMRAPSIRNLVEVLYERRQDWKLGDILAALDVGSDINELQIQILSESPDAVLNLDRLQALFDDWAEGNQGMEFWISHQEANPDSLLSWVLLGMAHERENNLGEALKSYENAVAVNPENALALYKLGEFKVAHETVEEGLQFLVKAAHARQHGTSEIARRCLELGDQFRNKGDCSTALQLYRKAYEIAPGDLWPLTRKGECHETLGDYAAAREAYEWVLMNAPESPITAGLLDALCEKLGSSSSQGDDDACAGGAIPSQAPYEEEGILADCLEFWRVLCETHPHSGTAHLYHGMALERLGLRAEARVAFSTVLERSPDNALARLEIGALDLGQGHLDAGITHLDRALEQDPALAGHASQRLAENAACLFLSGDAEAAIRLYTMAIELAPGEFWYHIRLGEVYESLGNLPEAEKHYKTVLMDAPELPVAAQKMDNLFQKADTIDGAVSFWETLVERHPDSPISHFYLGEALKRENRLDEAVGNYEKALDVNPDFGMALYRLGEIDILQDNPGSGLARIRQAAETGAVSASSISEGLDELAGHFLERKDLDMAVKLYQAALEIAPEDLWPLVRLGEVHESRGDTKAALEAYRAVLLRAPESPVTARKMDELLRKPGTSVETRLAEWSAAAEQHPRAAVPLYYLAGALEDAGDAEAAHAALRQATEIEPDIHAIIGHALP